MLHFWNLSSGEEYFPNKRFYNHDHFLTLALIYMNTTVTNYVWYNQFSVVLILYSLKVYFFTCSYFRIMYSVLHLKDLSTSIRVKIRWSTLNLHTRSAPRLRTTTQFLDSRTKLSSQITWRVFLPLWRDIF